MHQGLVQHTQMFSVMSVTESFVVLMPNSMAHLGQVAAVYTACPLPTIGTWKHQASGSRPYYYPSWVYYSK